MRKRARSSSRRRAAVALACLAACVVLIAVVGPVAGAALGALALLAMLGAGMGRGGGIANRKAELLRGQISRGARFDPSESAVYDADAWARVRAERHGEQA
jgi:hypothetical protein